MKFSNLGMKAGGTYANRCSVEVTWWEPQGHLPRPFSFLEVRSQKKEAENSVCTKTTNAEFPQPTYSCVFLYLCM